MNKEFIKDMSRGIKTHDVGGEISPGSVGRRYEPKLGLKKHNERIHKENKKSDGNTSLPFTFSKIPKPKKTVIKVCSNCDREVFVQKDTVGVICSHCHTFAKVKEQNA